MKTQKNFKLSEESIASIKKLQAIFDDSETGIVERAIHELINKQNPAMQCFTQMEEIAWNQIELLQVVADYQPNNIDNFGDEYLAALQDFYEKIQNIKTIFTDI